MSLIAPQVHEKKLSELKQSADRKHSEDAEKFEMDLRRRDEEIAAAKEQSNIYHTKITELEKMIAHETAESERKAADLTRNFQEQLLLMVSGIFDIYIHLTRTYRPTSLTYCGKVAT